MKKDILVYGHGDKSKQGFETEADIEKYMEGGIFRDEDGRYRYSQKKRADIVVISRDGFAYGHFVVDSMEPPAQKDIKAYPPVKQVYLIHKSVRYENKVRLLTVGVTGYQFGRYISEKQFNKILALASGSKEFHP